MSMSMSSDDEYNPMRVLMEEEEEEEEEEEGKGPSEEQHHLRSIDSTVVIRQVRSEGLSFQLWPAATTLVRLLDEHGVDPSSSPLSPTLEVERAVRLRVLEVGAGTGLVGIALAAVLGASVTLTDLPRVLPNLEHNAEANAGVVAARGGEVRVAPLAWGDSAHAEALGRGFDLVVASDVVYHDHLYGPLLETMRWVVQGEVVMLMAHLRRWKKDSSFFKRARKLFHVEAIHVDNPTHGSRLGVTVYRFSTKRLALQLDNSKPA